MNDKTGLIFENHIILDQISSWPQEINDTITNSKTDLQNYLNEESRIDELAQENEEYRWNRPINKLEEKWDLIVNSIELVLADTKIVGFHCSRLLDFEISDILENGLRPLNQDFANSRIKKIYNKGLIPKWLRDNLINKEELRAENRVGNSCFFHCTSNLQWEMGINRLFKSWGGEAIYRNNEKNTALQKIGIPCIVVASIDRLNLNEHPNLSERMICIFLNNSYHPHDFDSFIKNEDRITVLAIIKRNDVMFNTLTNIEEWDIEL